MSEAAERRANPAESASARVVRAIIRGLYEGNYVPGQRLAEPELMEQFDVSRSTARESIRRMESEGIVTVLPHRGAIIRRMSLDEALDALLVMELCIGLACRQAAERIGQTPEARARFGEVWAELRRLLDGPDGYELVKVRNRFYRIITEISGNKELRRIVPGIHIHLIRRQYSLTPRTRLEDYTRMAEAILDGNGAAAETAARRHVARSIELVRSEGGRPG